MTTGSHGRGVWLHVDESICQQCRKCQARAACHPKAIRMIDRDEPPFIDVSLCRGCMVCMKACPVGAIVRDAV